MNNMKILHKKPALHTLFYFTIFLDIFYFGFSTWMYFSIISISGKLSQHTLKFRKYPVYTRSLAPLTPICS